jgi:hypothetical protein
VSKTSSKESKSMGTNNTTPFVTARFMRRYNTYKDENKNKYSGELQPQKELKQPPKESDVLPDSLLPENKDETIDELTPPYNLPETDPQHSNENGTNENTNSSSDNSEKNPVLTEEYIQRRNIRSVPLSEIIYDESDTDSDYESDTDSDVSTSSKVHPSNNISKNGRPLRYIRNAWMGSVNNGGSILKNNKNHTIKFKKNKNNKTRKT